MSDKFISRVLLLLFLSGLAFIFAPVFSGNVIIHDDLNIAIPETRSLLTEPGTVRYRIQDTGKTCEGETVTPN